MNLATKKWIFLKISSIILLPLMVWFIFNFIAIKLKINQTIRGNKIIDEIFKKIHFLVAKFILNKIPTY